ncbi:unnamed protein product [Mytilus coruscus]|uniref:Uncharacterized protein n=1 Tax=Mytilus coruscus TaxID=42192 RepID=A0A6J8BBC1_MYTCO|nr:unnamed protein product [Mytilus coruscus]
MATLRNKNWENILVLSIRVVFLSFLDTIFRFSYQYLGWASYIVRCLGLLTLLVVPGLPYSILLTVFRITAGTSNIIIAWLVTSLFIKCGETPGYPVHILIILKLVQIKECYEVDRLRFKELFGLSAHNSKRLLPGSVPSIYPKRSSDVLNEGFLTEPKKKLKTSKALQKRDKARTASCCTAFQRELRQTISSYKRWRYVNTLMRSVGKIIDVTTIRNSSDVPMQTPRPLCAAFTRPQKTDAIQTMKSRFRKAEM